MAKNRTGCSSCKIIRSFSSKEGIGIKLVVYAGLRLLGFSILFMVLSFAYFNSFWQSVVAFRLGILISIGYLGLWYYIGFKMRVGFGRGLLTGVIGSTTGLLSVILSIILLVVEPEHAPYAIMIPWSCTFLPLLDVIRFPGFIDLFVPHLSVALVILLTAMGSWHGQILKKKTGD